MAIEQWRLKYEVPIENGLGSRAVISAHTECNKTAEEQDPNALVAIIKYTHFTNVHGVGDAMKAHDLVKMQA